jgi:predicted nuclease with TOPRIM domain
MSTAKVVLTVKTVEKVLQEMIASGERISQFSVEKKAGLSNGALNYKVDEYIELKKRINKLKNPLIEQVTSISDAIQIEKNKTKQERTLKDKYRGERDKLEKENLSLESENKELLWQLYKLQKYINHLEQDGMADTNVVNFSFK